MTFRDEFAAGAKGAASDLPGCLGFGVVMLAVIICAAAFLVLIGTALIGTAVVQ